MADIKKESDIYADFRKTFSCFYERIDSLSIPDIHYCFPQNRSGWIECKYLSEWPKRADTATDFGVSAEQAIFLRNYSKFGRCFILVWVQGEYLLFHGKDAHEIRIRGLTKAESYENCLYRTIGSNGLHWMKSFIDV